MDIVSIVSMLIAVVAGAIAALSWRAARRSAKAAEESAKEAKRMSTIEVGRRHDELRPPLPEKIQAMNKPSRTGQTDVFGSISVARDYQVRATALAGQGESTISLDPVLRAGSQHRFHIESIPKGETQLQTQEIRFQFWPHTGEGGANTWTCPCDRAADESHGQGHWEARVPVAFTPPKRTQVG